MKPDENKAVLPDENEETPVVTEVPQTPASPITVPTGRKIAPGMGIIIFAIVAIVVTFAAGGLFAVSKMMQGAQKDGEDEDQEAVIEEEGDTGEEEESFEITEVEDDGILMVYTKNDELRLLNSDGTSVKIDDLVDPYDTGGNLLAYPCYPQWSPDGTKILYTSGLDIKVYDMVTETSSILYTGHASGMSGTTVYSIIRKYGWKDDDEILFINDAAEAVGADMKDIHMVTLLNIDTLVVMDWGTYDMDTGFGGASSDPADWMIWHFSDLLGLSNRLYYYDDDVYVQTRIGANTWVQIPHGGTHTAVADGVVETIAGISGYDMVMTPDGEYESDELVQDYILDAMGSAPVRFQYYNSVISHGGVDIVVVDAQGLWNLQEDVDGEYLYYTEIEDSRGLETALISEVPAATIESYYPTSNIKKVNLYTSVIETIVEGLDFDLR